MRLRTIQDFLVDISLTPKALVQRTASTSGPGVRIGYIGWTGHANLGDEAMFHAISRALAPNKALPLLPAPGERVLQAIGASGPKTFQAVVLGGGTLINPLYSAVVKKALSWSVPFFVAGTGVGSPGFGFSSGIEGDLREWMELLHDAVLVGVRGPDSAQRLKQEGVSRVEVIGDPALAFALKTLPPRRRKPRLILNLGPEGHAPNLGVAQVVREFLRAGGEAIGVALGAGDESVLTRFRKQHSFLSMTIESHRYSAERFLETVAGSEALISVRLHAAVLAVCAGVPPLLLSYRSKCHDFMASVGLEEFAIPTSATEDGGRFRELLREIELRSSLRQNIHNAALRWADTQRAFFERLRFELGQQAR